MSYLELQFQVQHTVLLRALHRHLNILGCLHVIVLGSEILFIKYLMKNVQK